MITKADKRAAEKLFTEPDYSDIINTGAWGVKTDKAAKLIAQEMQAEREAAHSLFCAVQRFLESSACTNGCSPNDMECDTSFARKAIKVYEEV